MTAPTPAEILDFANRYSWKVCRYHPDWDREDLVGDIALACVVYPPGAAHELGLRAKWATVEWFRRRLGRHGHKIDVNCATPFSALLVNHDDGESELIESLGVLREECGLDDKSTELLAQDLLSLLPRREQTILRCLLDGVEQAEIGSMLGVSQSRIHQIVKNKIRPMLEAIRAA